MAVGHILPAYIAVVYAEKTGEAVDIKRGYQEIGPIFFIATVSGTIVANIHVSPGQLSKQYAAIFMVQRNL